MGSHDYEQIKNLEEKVNNLLAGGGLVLALLLYLSVIKVI
jgi:hypothetical protein